MSWRHYGYFYKNLTRAQKDTFDDLELLHRAGRCPFLEWLGNGLDEHPLHNYYLSARWLKVPVNDSVASVWKRDGVVLVSPEFFKNGVVSGEIDAEYAREAA